MSYKIRWGDTLSALSRKFGTTVSALAKANGISNPDKIYAGRSLKIPGNSDSFSGGGSTSGSGSARTGGSSSGGGSTGGATQTGGTNEVGAPPGAVKGGVSLADLKRIMPSADSAKAARYLPYLNKAMVEAGITTKPRQAAFLAQLGHESGSLRYMEEIASGAAYEGRRDLGNTQPGDGRRFKGRGPIQLTGRANYAAASKALGIDLINNPSRAADPDVGFRIATWFWQTRGLNALADQGNFDAITKRINGGYNGKADRDAYHRRALAAL